MSLDISLDVSQCPHCNRIESAVMDKNITHNLTGMWRRAGVYDALYMSEGKKASEVTEVLVAGLADMEAHPEIYDTDEYNASNGWGLYKHALPWLREVVAGFRAFPNAIIRVSK